MAMRNSEGDAAVSYERQSRYSDESLPAEVQDKHNGRWCTGYGMPVVASVEDLHVSGDLDPVQA
jgi:site-specific DNA recombinase